MTASVTGKCIIDLSEQFGVNVMIFSQLTSSLSMSLSLGCKVAAGVSRHGQLFTWSDSLLSKQQQQQQQQQLN